jgi:hypothetical protein
MKTLKHLCFIGIAVLLASAMVSCDFVEKPDVSKSNIVGYTEDGTPLLSFKIKTPGRALSTTQAQKGIDYYEVVFYDGLRYYRTAWDWQQTGRIALPAADFGATGATLFAGKKADKTLLAVGSILTPPSGNFVGYSGSTIVFQMAALESDVTTATPSLMITAPTATVLPLPKTQVRGDYYPVFKVPEDTASITAQFTVGGITPAIASTIYLGPNVSDAALTPPVANRVTFTGESSDNGSGMAKVSWSGTIAPSATTIPTTGQFTINGISTTADIGFAKMAIEIPVTPLNPAANAITWFIRGGIRNGDLDQGAASSSPDGGAFLLGVGGVTGYTINPGPGYPGGN